MASIGIALSGGGYRATTWALGTLLYLADAGKHADVRSISSVSGGSIANGYVAHEVDFRDTDPEALRSAIRPLLRHIAHEGLFFFGAPTNAYVVGLLASLAAFALGAAAWIVVAVLLAVDVLSPAVWMAGLTAGVVLAGVVAFWLFVRRSVVVDHAMARRMFSRDGKATRLADIRRSLDHVFCSTELQSGDHFYFAPTFAYGFRQGVGGPGDLTLSTAVQCSACLPGAFRARKLPTGRHEFRRFDEARPPETPPRHLLLYDGGVYDNMADQWHQGLESRRKRWQRLTETGWSPPDIHDVDELIVVNASAGWDWSPLKPWEHVAGELAGILRAKSVMYDATTAHRRHGLVGRFDRAALSGEGLRGALVHIPQSPRTTAARLAATAHAFPERAERAQAVLDLLDAGPFDADDWDRIAETSAGVGTVLKALGPETTAHLLHHSYVLAMCNLHIVLGYPLLDLPDRAEFEALVG